MQSSVSLASYFSGPDDPQTEIPVQDAMARATENPLTSPAQATAATATTAMSNQKKNALEAVGRFAKKNKMKGKIMSRMLHKKREEASMYKWIAIGLGSALFYEMFLKNK